MIILWRYGHNKMDYERGKSMAKTKPAAIFLIVIAGLVVLSAIVMIAFSLWFNSNPEAALRIAFTPSHPYAEDTPSPQRDYTQEASWAALPGNGSTATSLPEGIAQIAMVPEADVFFVHPTTYLQKDAWNAPDDAELANMRVDKRSMKLQASVFNGAGQIYAPRYRQATFGAFFDETGEGLKALMLANQDVVAAFDEFIANRNNDRPFILAGHSQGSLHLLYLLQQRISGTELQKRMIAAYLIGWPISIENDLGALADIKACERKAETGCVISYQTFGLGGNPAGLQKYMDTTFGLNFQPRKGTQMLCSNPQDWLIGSNETRSAHRGAMARSDDADAPLGAPIPHFTGTQCGKDGVLYIVDLPGEAWQQYKMDGENYHVYDYHMFYMNLRENAVERAQAWLKANR